MNLKELKDLLANAPDETDLDELLPKKEVVKVVSPDLPTEIAVNDGRYSQFKHSVNTGDLIAAMGCLKKFYDVTKRKTILLQTIGMKAQYYSGAVHPVLDDAGNPVTMNMKMWGMIKPLLDSQEYIHSSDIYNGQKVDIDFDTIRGKTFVNMPHGTIQGWLPIAYPDLGFDISKPWIELKGECPAHIKGQVVGKVILNFTERYRADFIDYFFLKNYAPDLIFAGTEKEWWDFCNTAQLSIPRLEVNDFLEIAYALREARFTMCNQSAIWNLCQALGTPRVLEMCRFADNCFPNIGEDSEGYFYQLGAEYYFRTMYNKTANK